ncbi:pyroglutamyl-peptidase I [Brachybacterium sp. GCM10030267]|uniref:pyroglutamyl-peptidase I n=1 Tax=Brachybacterium sp. GCM10030267 TaxID=3273381 RepID=UPI0036218064
MTTDVLLTGFAPFGGELENPSWEAVRRAAPMLRDRGVAVQDVELPVEFGRAGDLLEAAVREHRPGLVIATGVAAGRTAITPERVAINIRDARIPDNAGAAPIDEPVITGGPVAYFTDLPIKAMVAALSAEAIPAAVSQTAGTYVCNDVFYRLQHLVATGTGAAGAIRGGFVHVPSTDVVDVGVAAAGLVRLTEVALGSPSDVRVSGGALH